MIRRSRLQPEVNPNETMETALEDIAMAIEDGDFKVETPRGKVDEPTLRPYSVEVMKGEKITHDNVWVDQPELFCLDFDMDCTHESDAVHEDIVDREPVVLYGKERVWLVGELFTSEVTFEGSEGEKATFHHEHAWNVVEKNGWRYQ